MVPVNRNIILLGYNIISLYNTPPITSDILWYQLIPTCYHNIILLGYNDISLYDTQPNTSDILWYQLIPTS